jgi:hypothetical protein
MYSINIYDSFPIELQCPPVFTKDIKVFLTFLYDADSGS